MEWLDIISKAINYIEDNLGVNLSNEMIANQVYVSNYHFQRTFTILTGLTVGEYIRNRRLSLAADDLSLGKSKVIDVAYKYGYDSVESFSKAFKRFHGISPTLVKKGNVPLKAFNRFALKIIVEGASIMDYKIVKKDAFEIVLAVKEFDEVTSTEKIPQFWGEFFKNGYQKDLCPELGVCLPTNHESNVFSYGIGCFKEHVAGMRPEYETKKVPAYTWAIFKCVGPMPKSIQNMWKKIVTEWLPNSNYRVVEGYELEVYTDGDTQSPDYVTEIWLPVVEK